ncbi:hypothetical protein BGW41_007653 [Actinomortierella wolfii]|nr:hypothetical protein BGW41_007653 [Actinomortierella wolfii]
MLQYDTARDPKATYGYDIAQSLKKHASLIRSLSLSNFGALEFDCLMACISCPSIAENAIFNGSALSVTRAAGQLSRITLKDFEYAHCIVHSLLQEQPNLREIIISPRGWGSGLEYAFLDLFEMMPQWKQLETFELGSMFPSAKMPFKYLVKFLGRCPTLRRLVLHGLLIEGGQCATTSAIAAASPGNTLWACSDKLEILNLELNAHRYKDEVLRESDQTDVHDDQSVLYDNDVVADDNPMMYLNILLSDLDQESPYHGLRIPDEFTDDEMDLIRRQLDALGILKVLRLGGEAMSYDLLTVPQSSHFHPSESSSLSNFSLQSEGPEHTASRDYKDLKVKALDKKEHRAVRPLLTKNPDYIHISTNIPPINRNGEYQSPDASRLHRHEALKLREIADWWRTYANPLLERGEIGTKYHSQLYKAYFCYYGTS